MSEKIEEGHESEPLVADLPEAQFSEQDADAVKGGRAKRGGDDDLEDLEVERAK